MTRVGKRAIFTLTLTSRWGFGLLAVFCLALAVQFPNADRSFSLNGAARGTVGFSNQTERLSVREEQALHTLLHVVKLAALGDERLTAISEQASQLYSATNDRLVWVERARPTSQAQKVLTLLRDAGEKGLDPEDYAGSFGTLSLASLDFPTNSSESALIRFDLALTLAAMQYVSDLRLGRANPNAPAFSLKVERKTFDLASFMGELAEAKEPVSMLEAVEPSYAGYRRTLAALHAYRGFALRGEEGPLPEPIGRLVPGMAYPEITRLRERLMLLGDLSGTENSASSTYDRSLVEGVRRFQERHGLDTSGLLDPPTVRELNVPFAERVQQLQLTLERWRWLPQEFARPPIVVNIPEFRLHVIDAQHHVLNSMNVVVGRAFQHETPVFLSEVRSILFRPPWNVPLEIQRNELVPQIEKYPAYLTDNSYEIVDSGGSRVEEFPPTAETVGKLKSGRLFLRQRPGDENSLGLMKFEIPNPYDIYLHGTPARELFSKTRRDFSHGCVRVEDPVGLAVWLLRDNPGWDQERIETTMHGTETERVVLAKPTPVWIVYGTAVVLEDGRVRFFKDLYGQDAALQRELARTRGERLEGETHFSRGVRRISRAATHGFS